MKRLRKFAGSFPFKRLLAIIMMMALIGLAPTGTRATPSDSSAPLAGSDQIDLYDVDAMAARFSENKDFYQKLRDEGIAFYSSQNPTPSSYDDNAREIIRLAAYYVTWGDYYGEGVLRDLVRFKKMAEKQGCLDPFIYGLYVSANSVDHTPPDAQTLQIVNKLLTCAEAQAPAAFRLWEAKTAIVLVQNHKLNVDESQLISLWEKAFAQLIQDHAPTFTTYNLASYLLDECSDDDSTENLVIGAIHQAYHESGKDSGLCWALDGDFFLDLSWGARGPRMYGPVNPMYEGRPLEGERLQKAQQILEAGYAKFPDESKIASLMIRVAMEETLDRSTMEMWFQRAIKTDPNNFGAYAAKMYYLQPRWYAGNGTEVWKFSQECIASQNWSANIPMVLAKGLDQFFEYGDPLVFTRPPIWKKVEATYRKYLSLYPRSSHIRTYFLKAAYVGHHPNVLREQYNILGANWDHEVISQDEYDCMTASLTPNQGSGYPDMDEALVLLQKAETIQSGPAYDGKDMEVFNILISVRTVMQDGGAKPVYRNHRHLALKALDAAASGVPGHDQLQAVDDNIKLAMQEIHNALQAAGGKAKAAPSSI
jgi:hypothetical protein